MGKINQNDISLKSYLFCCLKVVESGLKCTLESEINVPLHSLIFGIFSRGYGLIMDLKDLNFIT